MPGSSSEHEKTRFCTVTSRAKKDGKMREAVIAVHDDVGDGWPIPLANLSLRRYMKNPVVCLNHDRFRQMPIGRTEKISWDGEGRMVADFWFSQTYKMAREVEGLWDEGIMRAASITARPVWSDEEESYNWEEWELIEWSVVGVPADEDAVSLAFPDPALARAYRGLINRSLTIEREEPPMPEPTLEDKIRAAVRKEMEAQRGENGNLPVDVTRMVTNVMETVTGEVSRLYTERDEAQEQVRTLTTTVSERDATIVTLTTERDEAKAERSEQEKKDVESQAAERADLLTLFGQLLPEDFERSGKTNHEIMVAAAGDAIEGAATMHPERLRALLEAEVERRSGNNLDRARNRGGNGTGGGSPRPSGGESIGRPYSVMDMQRMGRVKPAGAA